MPVRTRCGPVFAGLPAGRLASIYRWRRAPMPVSSFTRYPALLAMLSQLLSLLLCWLLLLALARLLGWHLSLLGAACVQGAVAAVIGRSKNNKTLE